MHEIINRYLLRVTERSAKELRMVRVARLAKLVDPIILLLFFHAIFSKHFLYDSLYLSLIKFDHINEVCLMLILILATAFLPYQHY